jgi:Uri superfamily endonuclease
MSPTGQPSIITGDGQNILLTTNGTVKEIDPTGAAIWNQSINVSNGGKAIKAGKYVYLGTGNDAKALNKNDGSTKWTSLSPLGSAQPIKYVYIKGTYILVSNDAKAAVLDRETGDAVVTAQDAPCIAEPKIFGGYYLAPTATGVQAYKAFMLPDLRIQSISKESDKVVAKVQNIGLSDSTGTLMKFVVRKTDGTYRTIHINAGTVSADNSKDVTITGSFSKGYAIVDPYYKTPELNEGNNQRYFY